MTNAELLAKIKAEIERRWKDYRNSVTPDQPKYRTHYFVGKGEVCEELLSFLDTLEEPKKDYNQLYKDIAESEWFKKSYVGKSLGDVIPVEEPACEELEGEISRYLREECSNDDEPSISEVARHFYELGVNARKA